RRQATPRQRRRSRRVEGDAGGGNPGARARMSRPGTLGCRHWSRGETAGSPSQFPPNEVVDEPSFPDEIREAPVDLRLKCGRVLGECQGAIGVLGRGNCFENRIDSAYPDVNSAECDDV